VSKQTVKIEQLERPVAELSAAEAADVAGGIIIVGGNFASYRYDRVALNPQPLPPRYFSFFR